jgi:lipoprotein-releasing system permease protein
MKLNVNTDIAVTYLLSRKKQTAVAAAGVMFGISMFIFMQSMMKGTNDYFEKMSFTSTPHIKLYSENKVATNSLMRSFFGENASEKILVNPKQLRQTQGIINPYGIIDRIKKNKQVAAITPQVTGNVIYTSGSVELPGNMAGVDIVEEDKMFDMQGNMVAGNMLDLNRVHNSILIGKGIADKLSLHVGDNITVRAGNGNMQIMRVVGVFSTTVKAVDETKSFANISSVQSLIGKSNSYVTEIKINIKDYNNAPAVAREIEAVTGYKAEDWVKANEQLKAGFKVRAVILNAVIGVLLLVAGFGIYNILNMTIYEKMKEIAILKAQGFPGKSVTSIFLQQAVFIGILGGVVGVIVGFTLTLVVSKIYIGAGTLKYLPMSFHIPHYIQALSFGIFTTVAAGYFPARKAAKVDPVTIIRG